MTDAARVFVEVTVVTLAGGQVVPDCFHSV